MLTTEQKRTLKLFLQYPDPDVETSRDDIDEVCGFLLIPITLPAYPRSLIGFPQER